MFNKLISLVILTFFLLIGYSYSDNQFIYPKKKPSIFKEKNNTINQQTQNDLPQKKPVIQSDEGQEKQVLKNQKSTIEKVIKPKEELIKKKRKKVKNRICIS